MMRWTLLLLGACVLSACKVVVIAPPQGAIVSQDLAFYCSPGNECEIDFTDFSTDMALHVIPQPGYRFSHWSDAPRHLCPGFTDDICRLNTGELDPADPMHVDMLNSNHLFYLQAVMTGDEQSPDPDNILHDGQQHD